MHAVMHAVPPNARPPLRAQVVEMAVSWCGLGSSPKTFLPSELAVGAAGLGAALLLCASPATCAAFLGGGGLHALCGAWG